MLPKTALAQIWVTTNTRTATEFVPHFGPDFWMDKMHTSKAYDYLQVHSLIPCHPIFVKSIHTLYMIWLSVCDIQEREIKYRCSKW